jgi:uncharacterized protein YnzC (UPF0291/DUF896 family)
MNIEDTIGDCGLPVNAIAMINRLRELMDEHGTNALSGEEIKQDVRVRKLLWLINQQFFGQLSKIDMMDEWDELVLKPTFKVLD